MIEKMLQEEPLKSMFMISDRQYINSKMLDSIEKILREYGNQELLD